MRLKGLLKIAMFFLAGAVVIVGAAALVGYVWYTNPEVINNLLYTATPGAINRNPYAAISVAGKSISVLTATNSLEDEPKGTPLAYITVESTSTSTPTITGTISETPTVTLTETATNTLIPTITTSSPVNTAVPYTPANTKVSYPTATKTQAPYYPPPTKTFTPTTQIIPPTATKTPTPTTSDPQSPPPTNTDTPTPTNTATFTPAPPENSDPPPTSTFTPTATTSGPAPTPTIDISGCSYANHGSYENELLGLINDLRNANGLDNLNIQYQLAGAATEHSNDMACNNFVSHTGSNGTSNHDRILAYGYSYSWRGENIYMGWNTTPQEAFNWWINSEPHLNNLLGSAYIHIGIGHTVVGSRNAYTLVFGRP